MLKTASLAAALGTLLTMVACTTNAALTPTPAPAQERTTNADGSTLKAAAPSAVSPTNSETIATRKPTLIATVAAGQFVNQSFSYDFELQNDAGQVVRNQSQSDTTWTVPDDLNFDTAYRWRARAQLNGAAGPWSATARFLTPKQPVALSVGRDSSTEEWRIFFFALIQATGAGPNLTVAGMQKMRPDLLAVSADFQNGWRGDLRGRLFLPVPGCNGTAANNPSPPGCAFNRTVDLGDENRPWQWIVR